MAKLILDRDGVDLLICALVERAIDDATKSTISPDNRCDATLWLLDVGVNWIEIFSIDIDQERVRERLLERMRQPPLLR